MNEIRVLLCGGLGNQLFQYAFGRALALRTGVPLALDAGSLFLRDFLYQRQYQLEAFRLSQDVQVILKPHCGHRIRRSLAEWSNRGRKLQNKTFLKEETPYRFQDEWMQWKPSKPLTVLGYWQSERYFLDVRGQLLEELTYQPDLSASARKWKTRIQHTQNSVAVHARRVQYGAKLPDGYQEHAINEMRNVLPGVSFFLFSDDPVWAGDLAKQHTDVEHVLLDEENALEDFELMRACNHFIIANSSFSWWAAWLGEGEDSVVIVPESRVWNHLDTVPGRWRQLSVRGAL